MDQSRLIFLKNFNDYKIVNNNNTSIFKKINTKNNFENNFFFSVSNFVLLDLNLKLNNLKINKLNCKNKPSFYFVSCKNTIIIEKEFNIHIYNF